MFIHLTCLYVLSCEEHVKSMLCSFAGFVIRYTVRLEIAEHKSKGVYHTMSCRCKSTILDTGYG